MSCNQFRAPNGEPSLLYAGLLQKYGADKALQIWNWTRSAEFKPADSSKDVNGEVTLTAVEQVYYDLTNNSKSNTTINIYSGDKNGFEKLSNLLHGPVQYTINGKELSFKTVEHLFQSLKAMFAGDSETANKIFKAASGFEAQKLGKTVKNLNVAEWDKISSIKLEKAMIAAFKQNEAARNLLLSTTDARLTHKASAKLGKWETEFPRILTKIRDSYLRRSKIEVSVDSFKADSLESFSRKVDELYKEARENPSKHYHITVKPTDVFFFKSGVTKKISGAAVANLLDKEAVPSNITFENSMRGQMLNLPKNFAKGLALEDGNPLQLSPAAVERQMSLVFTKVRDMAGEPTGQYFDPEIHNETLNTIIFDFYNVFSALADAPNREEKLAGKSVMKYLRDEIFGRMEQRRAAWTAVNAGKSNKIAPSDKSKMMVENLTNIINAFYVKGDQNHFWNFAIERLSGYGIKMKKGEELANATSGPQTSWVEDENGDLQVDEGAITKDRGDSSFEMDMKDTASTRLKLWLLATTESKFIDEAAPEDVTADIDLFIGKEATRELIQKGIKRDLVLSPENAAKLKLSPLSTMSNKLVSTERDKLSQKITMVNGSPMRLTAVRTATAEDIADTSLTSRIQNEEGRTPAVGDVIVKVEPYTQRTGILAGESNFLGVNKLANFEQLFQDLASLLASREPSLEGYLSAMEKNGNANIQRVAQRLRKEIAEGNDHIAKEFVAVMSAHYQRMLMILTTRSKEGYLETTVIDSNRASEVQTIQKFWQEQQKSSPILQQVNNANQRMVSKEIAEELWNELQDIYNSTPGRTVLINEDTKKKLGSKFDAMLKDDQIRYAAAVEAWQIRKKAYFKKLMNVNGINLHDKTYSDLMPDGGNTVVTKLGEGTKIKTMFGGFTQEGAPNGLVDILTWRLAKAAGVDEGELENGEDFEPFKANNPLYVENTAMKILAKAELKYTPQIYSQTHKSSENKTIYSYGLNSALSHAVRRFKENKAYRDMFALNNFAKNSWLLETLNGQSWLLDKFQLTYLDGIKNRYGNRDGVTRPDMSDREQWATLLGLFQNGGSEKALAHMVSLTHSDKTKTPVFMNSPRLINTMYRLNGKLMLSKHVTDAVYKSVFLSEHSRILQPGGENIRGYAEGKKLFYMLPQFNHQQVLALEKEGILTVGERRAIWTDDGRLNNQDNILFEPTAKKLINRQLNEMISATRKSWEDSKLTVDGMPGHSRYYERLLEKVGIDKVGENWMDIAADYKLEEEEIKAIQIGMAAGDYTVNSFLFNTGLSQLFYGDPALTFKKDVPTTMIEYGKRLAKDIAPGKDGEWSHSKTYTTVTSADYEPLVTELKSLPAYAEGRANATDAQEVTTVAEHLSVLYAYGTITKAQYTNALGVIKKANGGYYKFSPELESIIMQPMKPVATGFKAPVNGVMNYDYVKSSSFPLYPPMVSGLQLDKLRVAMEKDGVDRMNFISAKKIGAPVKILPLFSADGTIDSEVFKSAEWTTDARQSMDRTQFRIQQDNPYDEDKDAILTVSQMNKNIVERIPTIRTLFDYKGEQVNGTTLRSIKEDIRKQLITNSHAKFLEKVGAEYDAENDVLRFKDKKKFYNILAQAAKNGKGYTTNDLLALSSYIDTTDELVVPLAFSPSSSKFEGLMMSMIKKIVKIKMPGKSFIQASPAGFRTLATWEDSNLDRNNIVWTKRIDGDLKTAHIGEDGKVVPAQILVGFNYFTNKGDRINIQDYIKDVDGKKMLDTEKIPAELLQLLGARIPNQGHSSMLPIEIVGFLPQNMGDMVVVPAGITKQMGADFDVDKLFTYHRAYTNVNGKLEVVNDESDDRLKNDYFDVHWSVLTNPEMLPHMMTPLDKSDLKDMAEELSPAAKQIYYYSPAYQMNDFQSMKGAKVLVGQTSLALTSNAVMQTGSVRLVKFNEKGETVDASIRVLDEEGNPIELAYLSGFGETAYKGETRSKSDNIQIQQNESMDHAKNRIIDKINLTPNTSAASLALSRLQTADLGTPGEQLFVPGQAINLEYNALLLMQPIVQEYAAALSTANDTLSKNFESKVKEKVFSDLYMKYAEELTEQELNEVEEIFFNPKKLRESLTSFGVEFKQNQLAVWYLFKQLDSIGSQLITVQSTMAQDTRGAGKDMLGALNIEEKRNNPNTTEPIILEGVDDLFDKNEEYTEVGVTYKNTIGTALGLYGGELPYEKLQPTYKRVIEQSGKDGLNDDQKKLVFNAMKSFAFNHSSLGLYKDAYAERVRLLFSTAGNQSLAKRVQAAKTSWGKNNYFLQRLQTNIDIDGLRPDMIEYNASKASMSDDVENSKAWLAMLTSADEEIQKLGYDLLRYGYITGGLQGARNFVKYMPWAAIEGSAIAEGLRTQFNNISSFNDNDALLEQIFQHNPSMARQLSENLKETGSEYEELPETFLLPVFNPDDKQGNPAAGLAVTLTGNDGRKYENYPTYLSVRVDNKWTLYKQTGRLENRPLYSKIDLLGDSKLQLLEYSSSAGIVGTEGLRSVVAGNRASAIKEDLTGELNNISNAAMDKFTTSGVQLTTMRQVGLTKTEGNLQDIINALGVIEADGSQPSHIRVVAGILNKMDRNPAEYTTFNHILRLNSEYSYRFADLGTGTGASFSTNKNRMTLNSGLNTNKHLMAELIVHEQIHYHTAFMMLSQDGEQYWEKRGFNPLTIVKLKETREAISHDLALQAKLTALEDARKLAFDHFKRMILVNFSQEYWDKISTDTSDEHGKLYYALASNVEFITHVLSDGDTIGMLNNIEYKGKKTLLEHVKELFSQLWGAITQALKVRKGSLAEESVKRALDILTHNQTINVTDLKANTHDFARLYDDLSNASVATKELTAVDKVIGKLEEQKQELIASFTGVLDKKSRLDKRNKIEEIEEDIAKLAESKDLMLVQSIGKKHLEWVAKVAGTENATANRIMTAIHLGNMWRGVVDLMYGDDAVTVDKEFADLAATSGNLVQKLITMSKDYMIEASKGVITSAKDFNAVEDISWDQAHLRSLSSAAKSTVVSHVANFIETTSRQRDEDSYRLMQSLNTLEKDMLAHVGGNRKALDELYRKMMQPGEGEFGLALQYSSKWFEWRRKLIALRNAQLREIDSVDDVMNAGKKRAVWKDFWNQVDAKATFVDTSIFFNPETGEFRDNLDEEKAKLAALVGEAHVATILARAQERYMRYVEDKQVHFEDIDEQVIIGRYTAEQAEQMKLEWQNKNSPNVFFNRENNARTYSAATERYVTLAPKLTTKEFWNEDYAALRDDTKTAEFYDRFKNTLDELLSYLPQSIQDRVGADFLPVVRKELLSDSLNVRDWVKTFNERFVRSMTASAWEEQMNEKAYSKIPIDYVDKKGTEVEDRSTDLIGITRLFGMMAMHYKHFSAAKDYIDMGETILREIEKTRVQGASQMEQNGKIVTVKKGLRNALDALEYLKEYAVYRKPKQLETNWGAKIHSKVEDGRTKFSLNPVKQIRMTQDVKALMKQLEDIKSKFLEGELTEEEYEKQIAPLNRELGKYEGFTMYGSKFGDKLIGINQLKALSYNPFSAVANVAFGMISVHIHAAGRRDFTATHVGAAQKLMIKAKFDKKLALKIVNFMDRLGVIGDYVDNKYGKAPEFRDNKAKWKKALDRFAMMRSSDFFMKGVTTMAMALHDKVKVADSTEVTLWDSLNEDGNWDVEKYGENKSWYSEDVKEQTAWDKFRNKVVRVNVILHGNQDKNAPKMLNKYILGRSLGQFRANWLPEGWYSRFQTERFDENLGRTVKGRYRSFFNLDNQVGTGWGIGGYSMILGKQLLNLIPGVKIDPFSGVRTIGGKLLSDEDSTDMENMRRNFSELGFFLMLAGVVAMLKHLQGDGDDKDQKLQLLINMLIRSKQDIDFYASPGVFDAVFRDPIPAFNVVKDYYKAMGATVRLLTEDDYEFKTWCLKMTKAGLPIPQATMINKTRYMMNKDLDALQ